MGQKFWVDLPPTSLTVAADLFEIIPSSSRMIRILAVLLGQTTELGDAAAEFISVYLCRGNTVAGSGGSSVTPRNVMDGGPAATFTANKANTTKASGGTEIIGPRMDFDLDSSKEIWFPKDALFTCISASGTLCLRLGEAPDDSTDIFASMLIEEAGRPGTDPWLAFSGD